MKKLKVLLTACAVMAAAWGSQASAAYQLPSTGNGALVFSAWDPVGKQSYTMGLGLSLNDLISGGAPGTVAPLSFDLSTVSAFTGLFSSLPSSLLWNVAAADSTTGAIRLAYTSGSTLSQLQGIPLNNQNVTQAGTDMQTYLGRESAHGCGVTTTGTCTSTSAADAWNINNIASTKWGANYGIPGNFNGSGSVGSILNFFFSTAADQIAGNPAAIAQFQGGTWSLSSNDVLTFSGTSAVSSVPVPAAIWLLGSGLFGLVGVSRRRGQAAAALAAA